MVYFEFSFKQGKNIKPVVPLRFNQVGKVRIGNNTLNKQLKEINTKTSKYSMIWLKNEITSITSNGIEKIPSNLCTKQQSQSHDTRSNS